MFPFNPWMWRDPALLSGGYAEANPDSTGAESTDSTSASTGPGDLDLAGYDVVATDGAIGSVDEASYNTGDACLVVDTGPWIFGRKVLLPAATVQRVDHQERKIHVDRTKDQIKESPEYDPAEDDGNAYRSRVGAYYEDTYRRVPPVAM